MHFIHSHFHASTVEPTIYCKERCLPQKKLSMVRELHTTILFISAATALTSLKIKGGDTRGCSHDDLS